MKMYSHSNDAIRNEEVSSNDDHVPEQREKEFFSIFPFAKVSSSLQTENTSSPLKTIHGAASNIFGSIWSAFDSVVAVLNEDINMDDSADGTYMMCDSSENALDETNSRSEPSSSSAADLNAEINEIYSPQSTLGTYLFQNYCLAYHILI